MALTWKGSTQHGTSLSDRASESSGGSRIEGSGWRWLWLEMALEPGVSTRKTGKRVCVYAKVQRQATGTHCSVKEMENESTWREQGNAKDEAAEWAGRGRTCELWFESAHDSDSEGDEAGQVFSRV